jgi:Uma2 family endonuclease
MAMSSRRFTVADLDSMPDDGNRYEVIEGVLYVTHAPHNEHQAALDQLTIALGSWYNATGLGWPVSGAGVKFAFNTGVIPDLLWFSHERVAAATVNPDTGERDGKFYAAPDLAVEILSPGRENEERDREVKRALYERRGVQEYWIVDRASRVVEVYRRTDADLELAATLTDRDTLTSPLLPGFALPVAQVFRLPKALRADTP